jgi:hypothetical protein
MNTKFQKNKLSKEDFKGVGFRHDFFIKELNYDVFKKKDSKIIVFWGEEEGHFYEVPQVWIVKNNLTLFKGDVYNKDQLELICTLVHV